MSCGTLASLDEFTLALYTESGLQTHGHTALNCFKGIVRHFGKYDFAINPRQMRGNVKNIILFCLRRDSQTEPRVESSSFNWFLSYLLAAVVHLLVHLANFLKELHIQQTKISIH